VAARRRRRLVGGALATALFGLAAIVLYLIFSEGTAVATFMYSPF
jgi:hypothetical protein